MGKQIVKLSTQGHRVMGALASFLAPRMAADQDLQSVELESICKSVNVARYDRQIDGIVGTVKERFASRLAADQNFNALRKSLTALMPFDIAMDKKKEEETEEPDEDEEDEDEEGEDGDLGDKFEANIAKMKAKAKDKKAKDEDTTEDSDDDSNDDANDKFPAKDKKAKDKKAKDKKVPGNNQNLKSEEGDQDDSEEEQWVKNHGSGNKSGQDKKACDAALRSDAADLAIRRIGARYEAAAAVKKLVGEVNVMASDSAADIYAMGIKAMDSAIDLSTMPKVAYKSVFEALNRKKNEPAKARFAQDAASIKTLSERYPNAPDLA